MKEEEKKESKYSTFVVHTAKYKTLLTKSFMERKSWEPENTNIIKAIIPGNINKIMIKKGDVVKVGDRLLVLEAMKMYNQILSPVNGKIKSIKVKEGEIVAKNAILVELE
ncbi:MAG: acetyl-CoA carboxylase biotin carboxyl carrier protein subunit [Bacteroidetes bacterium]|nr:acetyl-CoA carboxylase biotin carboxyl carrier protein subunit [Bacteroidota bacterium]